MKMVKAKDKVTVNGMPGKWKVVRLEDGEAYIEALDPDSAIILTWVDAAACEKVK